MDELELFSNSASDLRLQISGGISRAIPGTRQSSNFVVSWAVELGCKLNGDTPPDKTVNGLA